MLERVLPERRPRVRRPRHRALVAGTASRFGAKALRRLRATRRSPRSPASSLQTSRDWLTDDVRVRARARAARAVGAAHRPRPRRGGLRLHDAGDRRRRAGGRHADPRGGGATARRTRSSQLIRDNGGTCETGVDVERVLVATGAPSACAPPAARRSTAERAVIANVTPTQLYGRLLDGPTCQRPCATARSASATAAPRCRSTSRCREPPRWARRRAARQHRDRARDARPRRRLARRQRGGARAAARRGDDRRRPAARRWTRRARPRARASCWIQLQELPWQVKGDAAGELDVGDGTWTDDAARALRRPHPGAARDGTSRTSSRRILGARRALPGRPRGG